MHISQAVLVQGVKIAGIHGAVRLDHILHGADSPLLAGLRLTPRQDPHHIFKLADIGLLPPLHVVIPTVEQLHEEAAVHLRRQGVGLFSRLRPYGIQAGDELQVLKMIFLVKIIDFRRPQPRLSVDHRENVVLHPQAAKHLRRPHDLPEAALPLPVHPVGVVGRFDPVQGESHQEFFPGKKLGPLLREAAAVGLDAVVHPDVISVIFFLQIYEALKKRQPGQRGLPALKGKPAESVRVLEGLPHQNLQGLLAHKPVAEILPVLPLIAVEAVAAVQIAVGGRRLDQHL